MTNNFVILLALVAITFAYADEPAPMPMESNVHVEQAGDAPRATKPTGRPRIVTEKNDATPEDKFKLFVSHLKEDNHTYLSGRTPEVAINISENTLKGTFTKFEKVKTCHLAEHHSNRILSTKRDYWVEFEPGAVIFENNLKSPTEGGLSILREGFHNFTNFGWRYCPSQNNQYLSIHTSPDKTIRDKEKGSFGYQHFIGHKVDKWGFLPTAEYIATDGYARSEVIPLELAEDGRTNFGLYFKCNIKDSNGSVEVEIWCR